jgi:hypothetical protein
MSALRLDWIADSTFSELKKLRVLDLRNNSLRQVQQSSLASPPALQEVYLSGKLWTLSAVRGSVSKPVRRDVLNSNAFYSVYHLKCNPTTITSYYGTKMKSEAGPTLFNLPCDIRVRVTLIARPLPTPLV